MRSVATMICAAALAGCAHTDPFVWADQYEEPAAAAPQNGYVLQPDDVIAVRVLNQDAMSAPKVRVRTDGRISLPFLNDVDVAGQTPPGAAQLVAAKLKDYVNNPVVTVTVEEPRPFTVSVLGEVTRPGVYAIEPGAGVLHAIAAAGGLTQYSHEDRLYVLRTTARGAAPERIRFDYRALSHAQGKAAGFTLRSKDIVVVE